MPLKFVPPALSFILYNFYFISPRLVSPHNRNVDIETQSGLAIGTVLYPFLDISRPLLVAPDPVKNARPLRSNIDGVQLANAFVTVCILDARIEIPALRWR